MVDKNSDEYKNLDPEGKAKIDAMDYKFKGNDKYIKSTFKKMKKIVENHEEVIKDDPTKILDFASTVSTRYEFRESKDIEFLFDLGGSIGAFLHFYITAEENGIDSSLKQWAFAHLLHISMDGKLWHFVAGSVYKKGTKLSVEKFYPAEEPITLSRIYEIIMVFAIGVLNTELADRYSQFCAGIPQYAYFRLLSFLDSNDSKAEKFQNPGSYMGAIIEQYLKAGFPRI